VASSRAHKEDDTAGCKSFNAQPGMAVVCIRQPPKRNGRLDGETAGRASPRGFGRRQDMRQPWQDGARFRLGAFNLMNGKPKSEAASRAQQLAAACHSMSCESGTLCGSRYQTGGAPCLSTAASCIAAKRSGRHTGTVSAAALTRAMRGGGHGGEPE